MVVSARIRFSTSINFAWELQSMVRFTPKLVLTKRIYNLHLFIPLFPIVHYNIVRKYAPGWYSPEIREHLMGWLTLWVRRRALPSYLNISCWISGRLVSSHWLMPRLHSFLGEHNPFTPESISRPARQQRTLGTYLGANQWKSQRILCWCLKFIPSSPILPSQVSPSPECHTILWRLLGRTPSSTFDDTYCSARSNICEDVDFVVCPEMLVWTFRGSWALLEPHEMQWHSSVCKAPPILPVLTLYSTAITLCPCFPLTLRLYILLHDSKQPKHWHSM